MSTKEIDRITRLASQLDAQRQPNVSTWRDVFDYMAPERAQCWFGNTETTANNTATQRARIYDNTAIDAMEVLKSNISSGLTPENSRWFALDAGTQDEMAARWLDGAADFIFDHINTAGFASVSSELYSDLLPAGWFVLYIDEARDSQGRVIGGYNFEHWPLWQCFVACSRANGKVDTIVRRWSPTVEQLVSEYTLEKCAPQVRDLYEKGEYTQTVDVLWCIEPQRKTGGMRARNKPFKSTHIDVAHKHMLRESGYDEFPCAVPRWRLIPGTAYATGIGSNVLPDVKTLNEIVKMELMSLDVAIGGMWKAQDDGILNPRTVKIGPRRVVMVADINNFQPLQTGVNFNVAFSKGDQLREGIRRGLMADRLTPIGGPVRSATEIATITNQIRTLLSPILGRLQPEFLQVVVERCFNIAFRSGALTAQLGPIPEGLDRYNVRYLSPLARSQKMEEVTAIDTHLSGLVQLAAATQQMTVLDGIKLDESMYEKGKALGVPVNLLRGPRELAEKREMDNQAAQEAQQAQQQAMLQQEAGAAAVQGIARNQGV